MTPDPAAGSGPKAGRARSHNPHGPGGPNRELPELVFSLRLSQDCDLASEYQATRYFLGKPSEVEWAI